MLQTKIRPSVPCVLYWPIVILCGLKVNGPLQSSAQIILDHVRGCFESSWHPDVDLRMLYLELVQSNWYLLPLVSVYPRITRYQLGAGFCKYNPVKKIRPFQSQFQKNCTPFSFHCSKFTYLHITNSFKCPRNTENPLSITIYPFKNGKIIF